MGDMSPTWVRPSSSPWTVTNQQDRCHTEKQPCSHSLFMVRLLCAGSNPTALQGMATDLEPGRMWGQWQVKLRVEWPPHRAYGGRHACVVVSAGKAGSAGTALEPITHYSHSKTCWGDEVSLYMQRPCGTLPAASGHRETWGIQDDFSYCLITLLSQIIWLYVLLTVLRRVALIIVAPGAVIAVLI